VSAPPKLKRLLPEDYDFAGDATEWGPKLLQVLTTFCSDVTNALSGGLTRTQNMRGEEREAVFDFTNVGTPPAADLTPFPLSIVPRSTPNPRNLTVTFVEDITDATGLVPAGAVMPFWRLSADGAVVIRYLTGLDAGRRYRVRFLME